MSETASILQPAGAAPLHTVVEFAAFCRVDWARVQKPLKFICLVNRPYGIYLHWSNGGNKLCPTSLDKDALCAQCIDPKIKKGWYCAFLGHCVATGDCILALLPEASFHRAQQRLSGGALAGRFLTFTRSHVYSKVQVEVSRQVAPLAWPVMEEAQLRAIVEHVYTRMTTSKKEGSKHGEQNA